MSVWYAVWWGGLSSAALFLGQALSRPLEHRTQATGLLMGFGAGTLISSIAYELIPPSIVDDGHGRWLALAFLIGAVTYFVGDRLVDSSGGEDRTDLDGAAPGGSGSAMFIGALLDGLPAAFILGIGISLGGGVSVAFLVAVFVSNIPQGTAGTISLRQAGTSDRTIAMMWGWLTLASAAVAAAGFLLADAVPDQGLYSQAFAAGAVLVMLADSMMPEAFEHGGKLVGLLTVLGFLVAAILTAFG